MSDAAEGGRLLLQLYELRTEPELRRARAWFAFEFHPSAARDVLAAWLGPGYASAPYRMVTTYWEMAAALVLHGALSPELFHTANTEHLAVRRRVPRDLPSDGALELSSREDAPASRVARAPRRAG